MIHKCLCEMNIVPQHELERCPWTYSRVATGAWCRSLKNLLFVLHIPTSLFYPFSLNFIDVSEWFCQISIYFSRNCCISKLEHHFGCIFVKFFSVRGIFESRCSAQFVVYFLSVDVPKSTFILASLRIMSISLFTFSFSHKIPDPWFLPFRARSFTFQS